MEIRQLTYKGNTIKVYPIETETGSYVYDFIVNDGYWGTVFKANEIDKYITTLKDRIDKGESLY